MLAIWPLLLGTALADVLPPPQRPDWQDPPVPLPDPPEDPVPATILAVVLASAALLAFRPRGAVPEAS